MDKVAVIIPARDESENISSVLKDIHSVLPKVDIIVIDDRSSDKTGEIVSTHPKTILLTSPVNLGIGGAFQLGVQYAFQNDYDIYIRMDADGQHKANYLPGLLKELKNHNMVIGSRPESNFTSSSSFYRKLGSIYFSSLFMLFLQKKMPDPTSGFMCFNKEVAECISNFLPSDFPEIEMEVLLIRAGFDLHCVEVKMDSRINGLSHIDFIHSLVYVFSVSLAFFISFFRKNPYNIIKAKAIHP